MQLGSRALKLTRARRPRKRTAQHREAAPSMHESFEYYMVRVRRTPDHPGQVSGQVERLGTGEKRGFASGEQLAGLVAAWSGEQPAPRPGGPRGVADT